LLDPPLKGEMDLQAETLRLFGQTSEDRDAGADAAKLLREGASPTNPAPHGEGEGSHQLGESPEYRSIASDAAKQLKEPVIPPISAEEVKRWVQQGHDRARAGDFAEARKNYQKGEGLIIALRWDQSSIHAFVLCHLAECSAALGEREKAKEQLSRALQMCKDIGLENDEECAHVLKSAGNACYVMGDHQAAERHYRRALEILNKTGSSHWPKDLAECQDGLGGACMRQGKYAEAEPLLQAACKAYQQEPKDELSAAGASCTLAMVYTRMGDYKRAEPLFRQNSAHAKALAGAGSAFYASVAGDFGIVQLMKGDLAHAESLLKDSVHILESQGLVKTDEYVGHLGYLAEVYLQKKDLPRALDLFKRARETYAAQGAGDSRAAANLEQGLTRAYLATGDPATAETVLEHALSAHRKEHGSDHPDIVLDLEIQAECLRALKRDQEARTASDAAKQMKERLVAPTKKARDAQVAGAEIERLGREACAHNSAGDYESALRCVRQAEGLIVSLCGDSSPDHALALSSLGALLAKTGDYQHANRLVLRAEEICKQCDADEEVLLDVRNSAGTVHGLMGQYGAAERDFRLALEIARRIGPTHEPKLPAICMDNLAFMCLLKRRYGEGEALYRAARNVFQTEPRDDLAIATAPCDLASLYTAMGDYKRAEPLFRESLAQVTALTSTGHPTYARVTAHFGVMHLKKGNLPQAEALLGQALKILEDKGLGKDAIYLHVLTDLAEVYLQKNDIPRARKLLERAKETYHVQGLDDSPMMADVEQGLARACIASGDYAEAEPLLKHALSAHKRELAPDDPEIVRDLEAQSECFTALKKDPEAKATADAAKQLKEQARQRDH
jgi:tetratricopeptide (TPR) repeat protein